MREVVLAIATLQDVQIAMPMMQNARVGTAAAAEQARSVLVPGAMTCQAPDWQLDLALMERIRASLQPGAQ